MGVFVGLAVLLGAAAGLTVGGILIAVAVALARKLARSRTRVWPVFGLAAVVWFAAAILVMLDYPYEAVESGGDFMPILRNVFAGCLGYGASPGVALVLATLTALLCPRRPAVP